MTLCSSSPTRLRSCRFFPQTALVRSVGLLTSGSCEANRLGVYVCGICHIKSFITLQYITMKCFLIVRRQIVVYLPLTNQDIVNSRQLDSITDKRMVSQLYYFIRSKKSYRIRYVTQAVPRIYPHKSWQGYYMRNRSTLVIMLMYLSIMLLIYINHTLSRLHIMTGAHYC